MIEPGSSLDLEQVSTLLSHDGRETIERQRLVALMDLVVSLPQPPDEAKLFPQFAPLREAFLTASRADDGELLEERFLSLYAHLHMHEAPYTATERQRVNATGGYWSHAGGLSPILKAGSWIRPETVSVDLGAGNGLQALLMQKLYPHSTCCQIEISSAMVDIGHRLQKWLEIPEDRVEWRTDDVLETKLGGWNFVYLYRPVRPIGPGKAFYTRLASALEKEPTEVVIFSIADCLGEFLPQTFNRFCSDGHLTCYQKPVKAHSSS